MIKMYLVKTNQKPIKINYSKDLNLRKLIDADYMDSVSISQEDDNVITVILDDEGMLKQREKNGKFYGDYIICKINMDDGEYIDISEEEAFETFELLQDKPKNPDVDIVKFLNFLRSELPFDAKSFSYDSKGEFKFAQIIQVSNYEVIDILLQDEQGQLNNIVSSIIGYYLKGEYSLNDVNKFLMEVAEPISLMRAEQQNNFYNF